MLAELVHQGSGHRLHYPVDVDRPRVGMGPEADVDLVGADQVRDGSGRPLEERAYLGHLRLGQIGYVHNMPLRLHDQRADAEWTDAVLDDPACRLVEAAAR